MYKLVFLTDPHLNFIIGKDKSPKLFEKFIDNISKHNPDGVLITGDISEASTIKEHLILLADNISVPIYFVLGNHDFYYGSIQETRKICRELMSVYPNLFYLSSVGRVPLTEKTMLVGHDGWYDGLYSQFSENSVIMNDFYIIKEFKETANFNNARWNPKVIKDTHNLMKNLASEGANIIEKNILDSVEKYKNIIVATHVPPFRENSVYCGKISNDVWMPCFSSKILGDKLLDLSENYKNINFKVYCGHSHGNAIHQPRLNLTSTTGYAKYEFPWLGITSLNIE